MGWRASARTSAVRSALTTLACTLLFFSTADSGGARTAASCAFTLDRTPCADLALTGPSGSLGKNNSTLTLTVTVQNLGDAPSAETKVASSAAGWPAMLVAVPALPPAGSESGSNSTTVTLTLAVPDSQHGATSEFTLRVNPDQTAPESNPDNDTTTIDVSVPGTVTSPPPPVLPDLALTAADYSLLADQKTLELSVDVLNRGKAGAGPTQLAASAPGWTNGTAAVPALKPGAAPFHATIRLAIPPAQRGVSSLFSLTLDPRHQLVESDATNDSLQLTVAVSRAPPHAKPLPDLLLRNASHRFLDHGQTLLLRVTVANVGKARSAPSRLTASASGWPTAAAPVAPLGPDGAGQPVELRLPVPDGTRGKTSLFTLRVNPGRSLRERNFANDTLVEQVAVAALLLASKNGSFPWWALGAGLGALLLLAAASLLFRRRGRQSYAPPDEGGRSYRYAPAPAPGRGPIAGAGPPEGAVPPPAAPPVPERFVNTGFSTPQDPDTPFGKTAPLLGGETYLFWLEVGRALPESIEREAASLPELPADAVLDVIVFGAGLTPLEGEEKGTLRLNSGGDAIVAKEAGAPAKTDLGKRRLFFPVRTPRAAGTAQLRCNIYHQQVLIQSRLVSAEISLADDPRPGRLLSELDYTLAPSLDPGHLERLPAHRLSVLLNKSAAGTHLLTFAGEHNFQSSAVIDESALQDMIEQARGAMRIASWGTEADWSTKDRYLYDGFDQQRLHDDLVRFALRGFRLYAAIVDQLSGGFEKTGELNELMRRPGLVQIALRGSARRLLPAALFYDYLGFQTNRPHLEDYTLCPQFIDALAGDAPLEELSCFQGDCPARGAATKVCPSGFWGFRHSLGLPVSIAGAADAPTEIGYADDPELTLAVSTDPEFVQRSTHEQAIRALLQTDAVEYADSFQTLLAALKAGRSDVIYFYCHGGLDHGISYLQVGPLSDPVLTSDLFVSERIRWSAPRPLVFINGCHTAAVEPEKVVEFVSTLVGGAQAAGVVGTEVTVFEPLATLFGLDCLRGFLLGAPLGEAVRSARLQLLKAGNPLGLVYVPFALASLKLVKSPAGNPIGAGSR